MTAKRVKVISLSVQERAKAICDDVTSVMDGGRIWISCGEAHPDIYNMDKFYPTALKALERHAKFYLMTGPVILLDDNRQNGLLALGHQGSANVHLCHRPVRGLTAHFRVVETKKNYYIYHVEEPHLPLDGLDHRQPLDRRAISEEEVQHLAKEAIALFDSWVEYSKTVAVEGSDKLPLVGQETDLEATLKAANREDFLYLSPKEILERSGDKLRPYKSS